LIKTDSKTTLAPLKTNNSSFNSSVSNSSLKLGPLNPLAKPKPLGELKKEKLDVLKPLDSKSIAKKALKPLEKPCDSVSCDPLYAAKPKSPEVKAVDDKKERLNLESEKHEVFYVPSEHSFVISELSSDAKDLEEKKEKSVEMEKEDIYEQEQLDDTKEIIQEIKDVVKEDVEENVQVIQDVEDDVQDDVEDVIQDEHQSSSFDLVKETDNKPHTDELKEPADNKPENVGSSIDEKLKSVENDHVEKFKDVQIDKDLTNETVTVERISYKMSDKENEPVPHNAARQPENKREKTSIFPTTELEDPMDEFLRQMQARLENQEKKVEQLNNRMNKQKKMLVDAVDEQSMYHLFPRSDLTTGQTQTIESLSVEPMETNQFIKNVDEYIKSLEDSVKKPENSNLLKDLKITGTPNEAM
jgi:hypothetical protein